MVWDSERSLVLVGMMGAGKTAVGRRLASSLGLPFLDSDAEIEAAAGMSIPQYFEHYGEPAFREGHLVEICGHVNLNTATRDVLRVMAAGALGQDPSLATVPDPLTHQAAPLMAPPPTLTTLYAPSTGNQSEADCIADAIIRSRPFASPSQLAMVKDPDAKPIFGNPNMYRPGIHVPNNTRVQWSDAAAEEVFARMYEASTVRSRNFRVWVVGQALAPTPTANSAPQVLAEVRKVFTLFADPGQRNGDGDINPDQSKCSVIHENSF